MLINQGLIKNFSLFLDSVQNFGISFLKICAPFQKGPLTKKIHALYLLNSEDNTSKETIAAKITTEFKEYKTLPFVIKTIVNTCKI